MAKSFLEERGLKLVAFEQRHIAPFVADLSPENMREFESLYKQSPSEALEGIIDDPLVFTVEKDGVPVAITGLNLHTTYGLMWCLFSKKLRQNWISFARASHKLVTFYHDLHPRLISDVWDQNEMIHQWLLHLGFTPENAIELRDGQTVIRFVRCSPKHKSAQTASSRPVLH